MKILELRLAAFGPFTDTVLDLSGGDEGLHLVYGPNEAGKSSALRALRQLLYGIPRHCPDAFLHPFAKLRIGALLAGTNGKKLEVVRRKGLKKTLRGADDRQVLEESTLRDYIGDVDEDTFSTLFGIGHESLVEGGREVLRGDGDVGQLLFAAGAGVSGLRELLESLEERCQHLFKPRGQNPRINRSLSELETTRREMKAAELPTSEWREHKRSLEGALRRLSQVEDELRGQRRERHRLARIADALPLIGRRRRVLADLAELEGTPLLRSGFSEERLEAVNKLNVAAEKEQGASTAIRALQEQRTELVVPRGLLERADEIERLRGEVSSCRKALADLRGLEAQREQLEADARGVLRELRPGMDLKQVESLRLRAGERVVIQNLGNENQALEERCQTAAAKVRELESRLEADSETLRTLEKPRDPERLESAVRRTRRAGDLEGERERLDTNVKALEAAVAVELERLGLWPGTLEELETLPLVPEPTLDRYEELVSRLARDRDRIGTLIEETTQQDAELKRRLDALRLERAVPTEEDLVEIRKRRDAGWRLVRRSWENQSAPEPEPEEVLAFVERFAPGSGLTEAYLESVRRADDLADRLRREADRVAEKAQIVARREQLQTTLSRLEEERERTATATEQLQLEWTALWTPLGIHPLPPREMIAWTRKQKELAAKAAELRDERLAVAQVERKILELRDELSAGLESLGERPGASDEGLERLLRRAEAVLDSLAQVARRRQILEQKLEETRVALQAASNEAARAKENHIDWRSRWSEAMARLGLPDEARPAQANEVLERLSELFDKLKETEGLRKRTEAIHRDATRVERALRELLSQVAPDLGWLPFEEAAAELLDRYAKAAEENQKLCGMKRELAREETALREARATLEEIRGRLHSLCDEAGAKDHEELPEVERRSERRRQLEQQLESVDEQLAVLAGAATVESLIGETQRVDPDALAPRIDRLDESLQALEAEKTGLDRTVGSERNALESLQKSSRLAPAAEKAERVQELLAAIESQVEDYVHLRLAASVLRRGIDRYRARNQGPVLERAGAIFRRLTLGSFTGLEADVDDGDHPFLLGVRPAGGNKVAVDGMSDGSRDQLYLALRLATLERYLEKNPPLPFVVDDILVNFDDERARATLEVLGELSQRTQVLFFTHHRHLVDLAREVLPAPVLQLAELPGSSAQDPAPPTAVLAE